MKNLFDVTNKVVVVTGASSGLGEQFVRLFAENGAKVALLARRKERMDQLVNELKEQGIQAIAVACDVTVEESIIAAIGTVKEYFGRIDILINNAGVARAVPAEKQSKADWMAVIDANLTGVYLVAREVGKIMIEQKYGKIVNLGSIHSNLAINPKINTVSAYCASKGGVQMLTKALAAEWAQHGITVNAIGPAYFLSEMTEKGITEEFEKFVAFRCPMGRIGGPGELNGAILYFSSDASSYTTGQLLTIDGGWNTI